MQYNTITIFYEEKKISKDYTSKKFAKENMQNVSEGQQDS